MKIVPTCSNYVQKHINIWRSLVLRSFWAVFDERYQEISGEATEGMGAFGCALLRSELERCPVDRLDRDDR